ncbi:MAG: 2-oxoglutarate dehydrogenase complex dihydrolipoyllysine-residue succinyltransferase [Thermogemmatispora sp.]|jgi:2-oxoglutarate dehydrogenase E2 component (dihydrolipoamide succinyltransferase)|uniref:2-oxoglutarate dehydrogenase complex dihydrolipoyllysine-residue succinyltransferase n=1 Tax=Thermogemmatispora sp. TaxID=1968838 RepID=UPI001A107176|nr:2-oxoglutarate dehydrogenase complex dihydrolipoyllysine-residue succinyltransferase [Thermogemmatispora sp.]MBE3564119.1 2-oxoglutarate dehydrogenase complex dihydrolipoyllysine-residue succinyltransferase [Thermogemmatispora sp.]
MAIDIRVPTLGESVVEATVARWYKHEGEQVRQGEVLAELETDKVSVEVTAEHDGVLAEILKREGEDVAVGEVLARLAEAAVGEGMSAASAAGEAPTSREVPAQTRQEQPAIQPGSAASSSRLADGQRPPSPLARRIAAEYNIDLSQVRSSSPHGRVTKDDVLQYLEQQQALQQGQGQPQGQPQSAQSAATAPSRGDGTTATATPAVPAAGERTAAAGPALEPPPLLISEPRREERIRLSRRRLTIAQRLVEAQHTAAMLTTFNEVDMSAILAVRARHREEFKQRYGISLGFMSFFTKAVVGALKAFPYLNAELQGRELLVKHYYDIGIAVSTDEGLVVPVVRDADRKSFAEIEREIAELARRARNNELTLTDLQGGTFTITNGGVFGSLLSTPILNGPQVGILGMHKVQERPVVVDGQVVVRPMMYVALSYDHRVVDGREAVQFLVRVKELLEDPERLLLEG